MSNFNKDIAIKKITKMPKEQVAQVLVFMAGMEAEHIINEQRQEVTLKDVDQDIKT